MKRLIAVFMLLAVVATVDVSAAMDNMQVDKWLQGEIRAVTRELVQAWEKGEDRQVIDNLLATWIRLQIELANRSLRNTDETYFQKLEETAPTQGWIPAKILACELSKHKVKTDLRSILYPIIDEGGKQQ